jgi:hypothetical protein
MLGRGSQRGLDSGGGRPSARGWAGGKGGRRERSDLAGLLVLLSSLRTERRPLALCAARGQGAGGRSESSGRRAIHSPRGINTGDRRGGSPRGIAAGGRALVGPGVARGCDWRRILIRVRPCSVALLQVWRPSGSSRSRLAGAGRERGAISRLAALGGSAGRSTHGTRLREHWLTRVLGRPGYILVACAATGARAGRRMPLSSRAGAHTPGRAPPCLCPPVWLVGCQASESARTTTFYPAAGHCLFSH